MRGGALPPALLCAALGFALAFAPRRAWSLSLLLLAFTAVLVSFVRLNPAWQDGIFFGCWFSVILAAAAVHLPRGVGRWLALGLAVNSGFWAGATVAVAGARSDLVEALPCALLCLPGAWLVSKRWQIAVKVAASWLVAVAVLAATLAITTPTPGYVPDHMD